MRVDMKKKNVGARFYSNNATELSSPGYRKRAISSVNEEIGKTIAAKAETFRFTSTNATQRIMPEWNEDLGLKTLLTLSIDETDSKTKHKHFKLELPVIHVRYKLISLGSCIRLQGVR